MINEKIVPGKMVEYDFQLESAMQETWSASMRNHENKLNPITYIKPEAIKLLADPKLHPKEKVILDKLISEDLDSLGILDAAYNLEVNMIEMQSHFTIVNIPQLVKCDLVIFPWRWVGKSHKIRTEPNSSNKLMKKIMFKHYKLNLHKRKYNHLKKIK